MASPSLKKAQIRYTDKSRGKLNCLRCGTEWVDWAYMSVPIQHKRRRGWWKCPTGCNVEVIEDFPPPGEIEGGSEQRRDNNHLRVKFSAITQDVLELKVCIGTSLY